MKVEAEFRSDLFPSYPNEEDEINPGRYGKRLTFYLAEKLRGEGLQINEPFTEDWGWRVEVEGLKAPFMLGVGNVDGEEGKFLVFIDPSTPIIKKFPFKKIDVSDDLTRVSAALEKTLVSEPGIRDLEWQ